MKHKLSLLTACLMLAGSALYGIALLSPTGDQVAGGGLQQTTLTNLVSDFLSLQTFTAPAASSASGNQLQQTCHATYNFAVDGGGAPGLITPAVNCVIPANSIITNELIDWTTAATGTSNTTSIGITGTGGGAAILLAATAVGSLTGIVQGVILPQTASGFKKVTTAGAVTLTTAVAPLTNGYAEIWVTYTSSPE